MKANGRVMEMILSDRPWFLLYASPQLKLQILNDDGLIEGQGAIAWRELEKAQKFCENMMYLWEQVMISFEFADRIE